MGNFTFEEMNLMCHLQYRQPGAGTDGQPCMWRGELARRKPSCGS